MLDSKTAALYRGESRNAMKNVNLWKNGVVPYILDASVGERSIESYRLGFPSGSCGGGRGRQAL